MYQKKFNADKTFQEENKNFVDPKEEQRSRNRKAAAKYRQKNFNVAKEHEKTIARLEREKLEMQKDLSRIQNLINDLLHEKAGWIEHQKFCNTCSMMQCQNVRNSQFQELQEPINSSYQPTNSLNQSIISLYQPINSHTQSINSLYQLINLPNQQINSSYELINSPNQSINSPNENNLPDYFDLTTDEEMDEYTIPSIESIYQDLVNECESNTILRPSFEKLQ